MMEKIGGHAWKWAKAIAISYLASSSTLFSINTIAQDYRCFLPNLTDFQKQQLNGTKLRRQKQD